MSASAYGVTSNGSSSATPAYGQAVMLRTELPQASRVVRPAAARSRIAGSASCSLTKCSWMFWRVVMCPKPREYRSATSATALSCGLVQDALRDLDAHHLGVTRLALAVRAAKQTERTPLIGADLARFESLQHRHELNRCPPGPQTTGAPGRACRDPLWLPWSLSFIPVLPRFPEFRAPARSDQNAAVAVRAPSSVRASCTSAARSFTTSPMTTVPGCPCCGTVHTRRPIRQVANRRHSRLGVLGRGAEQHGAPAARPAIPALSADALSRESGRGPSGRRAWRCRVRGSRAADDTPLRRARRRRRTLSRGHGASREYPRAPVRQRQT